MVLNVAGTNFFENHWYFLIVLNLERRGPIFNKDSIKLYLCKSVQYSRCYDDSKTVKQICRFSDLLTFQPLKVSTGSINEIENCKV